MLLILYAALAAVVLGVVLKVVLDHSSLPYRMTAVLLVGGMALTGIVVAPGTVMLGGYFAKQSALSYDEFWNGYETAAVAERDVCEYDGSCTHTYDCDPYPYTYTVYDTVSDGKGGTTSVPRQVTEIRYHSCPYATEEWTYRVETTLEGYTVASDVFAADPVQWRPGSGIPGHVARGVPAAWQAVKDRIDRGDPGPVTAVRSYENYILASHSTILKRYSDSIEEYREEGMLPRPADRTSTLQASKAYGVGMGLDRRWREGVMRFNAALGTELQGDLHLVAVGEDVDPDEYTGALQAYWQSPELGDKALSKNALVVLVGTDGSTIGWSRAFTGMPMGNERLLDGIRNDLVGVPFDPEAVLGTPRGILRGGDVTVEHTDGVLEGLVWGENAFARVCMVCDDEEDTGIGFGYLESEIQPSTGQKVAILSISTFLAALTWVGIVALWGSAPPTRSTFYGSSGRIRDRSDRFTMV